MARSHGRLTVEPALSATANTLPVLLRPADGRPMRLQLLSSRDRVLWPTERRVLVPRYADAPHAELLVPTLPAFVASKMRHGLTGTRRAIFGTCGPSARSVLSIRLLPRCSGNTAPPTKPRGVPVSQRATGHGLAGAISWSDSSHRVSERRSQRGSHRLVECSLAPDHPSTRCSTRISAGCRRRSVPTWSPRNTATPSG